MKSQRMFWIILLLLVAFRFRVYRLDRVPPGLQVDDERWNLEIIDQVQRGDWQLFYAGGWGREGGFYYIAALWERLLGENYVVLRILSVFAGTLTVALAFRLVRRMFGWQAGWISGASMACSIWPLFYSRIIFRAVILPPLLLWSINLFWDGLTKPVDTPAERRHMWGRWIVFGLLYGLLFYAYTSARVLPFLVALFVAYLLRYHRPTLRARARPMLLSFLTATVLILPLLWTLLHLPEAATRLEKAGGPLASLERGDTGPFFDAVTNTLQMFFVRGSPSWRYNPAARPIYDPLGGTLSVLGLLLVVRRWRQQAHTLILVWWGIGLLPGFLSSGSPSTVRTLLSMPPTLILPALALDQIERWLNKLGPRWHTLAILLTVCYLALSGTLTWRDYFVRWPAHPEVREVYQFTLTQAAHLAADSAESMPVAMSGVLDENRDPYSVRHIWRSPGTTPRWFDGRYALLAPAADQIRLIVPEYVPLGPRIEELASSSTTVSPSLMLTADGRPILKAYTGNVRSAIEERIAKTPGEVRWGHGNVEHLDDWHALPAADLPVDAGGELRLRGYEVPGEIPRGETVDILGYWEALSPSHTGWMAFVHLINAQGEWVSGYDRLDVSAASWQPGDLVVQVHALWIPHDLAPGLYTLRVGLYDRETMQRASFQVQPQVTVDAVLVAALQMK